MKPVELYARVRDACRIEGLSHARRRSGIDPGTVTKMLTFSAPCIEPSAPLRRGFSLPQRQVVYELRRRTSPPTAACSTQ